MQTNQWSSLFEVIPKNFPGSLASADLQGVVLMDTSPIQCT